jgi:hypothetical protein
MTDHMVNLPGAWHYINQFSSSQWALDPSLMKCGPDATSMAAEFAYPGRWVPEQLMDTLYRAWAGNDVAGNLNGTTIEQIKAWLASVKIGYIDMQPLVDEFARGNKDPLRLELGAMNAQNVPQIITVVDEAPLYEAVPNPHYNADDATSSPYIRGAMLHPWAKPGEYSHVMLRVGYSDSDGYGLYADGAAPSFSVDSKGNFTPVKILWSDIEAAGVMHCLAIMPPSVDVPPADFDYRTGTWPIPPAPPKPVIDVEALASDLETLKSQMDSERASAQAATDATFLKLIAELKA